MKKLLEWWDYFVWGDSLYIRSPQQIKPKYLKIIHIGKEIFTVQWKNRPVKLMSVDISGEPYDIGNLQVKTGGDFNLNTGRYSMGFTDVFGLCYNFYGKETETEIIEGIKDYLKNHS